MMAINQRKLDAECENYCGELRNKVVLQRKYNKQGSAYWDYPTVASVCQSNSYGCKKKNFSRPMRKCNQLLLKEICKYGKLGEGASKNKPHYDNAHPNYPLGNCAEQHAASDVLNELDKKHCQTSLGDLFFSQARYVRDNRATPACLNCQTILPNAK